MNTLLIANAFVFGFMGFVWSEKDMMNAFIRYALFVLALSNFVMIWR